METPSQLHPWFALQVRTRFENAVAAHLAGKGYEWLLPLCTSRRRWSDRIKDLELPLFPGYVFCRFDPMNRLPILMTPWVKQVVGVAKVPTAISENEIAAIQLAVRSGLRREPWPFLEVGQQVRVKYGPLAGLQGLLLEFRGQHRLLLSVSLLRRSVAVEIDGADVDPIAEAGKHREPRRVRPEPISLPVPAQA